MNSGWEKVKLEDILLVPSRNGLTKPSAIRGKGVKMIAMGELFAHPIICDIEMDRVPVTDKELLSSNVEVNDLLFARQSLTLEGAGKCSIVKEVKEPTVFESHLIRLRINSNLADPWYVYYYFNSYYGKHSIQNIVNQVAAAGIKGSDLVKLEIPLPSLEEQKRISSVLFNYDEKISANKKICCNLESQIKSIYKYWFKDFEPFKNQEFTDTEFGKIPSGWKLGTLIDILENVKVTTKQGDNPELPYLPIDSIPMKSFLVNDVKDNSEAQSSLILFKKYDILVGAMRVYFHRVIPAPFDGITRSTCFVLRPKVKDYYSFALCSVNSNQAILHAQKTSKGSTMPYAVWDGGLGAFNIVIPPETVAREFNLLIKNDVEMIQNTYFENQKLRTIRDTLLPKLMSGQIKL